MSSIIRATTTSGLQIASDNSGSLQFQTNGTTAAVTIDTSQNVGIGTTSPVAKQTIYGNGNMLALQYAANGGSALLNWVNTAGTTLWSIGGGVVTAQDELAFLRQGVHVATFNSSAAFILAGSTAQKATGTTWSNPSDQRLKDNIRDYTKGIAELMQVRVREWEYNGKGNTTQGMKGLGVVADEVMAVLPNTVETYNAKLNTDDAETTAIKKFDATEITWLLVKTVQEQQAIINDLKARVETLEAK
jgi:hypothetical protein